MDTAHGVAVNSKKAKLLYIFALGSSDFSVKKMGKYSILFNIAVKLEEFENLKTCLKGSFEINGFNIPEY